MRKDRKWNWRNGWQLILGLVLLGLLVGLATPAQAADFRGGDNVVIGADEVVDDDLFVSGNRVEINGTVKGDLFATGTEVIVNGIVEGSLMISGQTLNVNGRINGSLYSGGYALTLGPDAVIDRNVYFGGFSLTTESGNTIGRSLYSGNYQTILNGEVADDVQLGAGALELNGRVGGDVLAEVGDPDQSTVPAFMPDFPGAITPINPGFRQGAEASVGGEVDVRETAQFAGRPGATDSARDVELFGLSLAVTQRIGEFIALLIVGGLLIRYWPSIVQRSSIQAQERPLPSAGYGCLTTLIFFVGVPIVAGVIFILALVGGWITFGRLFGTILSLGGASLWLVVVAFFFVFSLVTKAIVAFLGGRLILTRLAPQMQPGGQTDFLSLALGAFIYEILRAIPLGLGWLIAVVVTLIGLGALYLMLRGEKPPSDVVTPPTAKATA